MTQRLERILYIFLIILLFGVMIAIHEFGHFLTAKLMKVKVNEFSIGMGPALWSKQKGETLYSLRVLPIGGYCAMEGEDEDTGDPGAFARQKGWKKILILCAGSVMNFLLGLAIVLVLFSNVTATREPVISQFADGFACRGEEGLLEGDRIIRVDGHGIWVYSDLLTYLERNDGQGIDLVVERDGERLVLDDLPMYRYEYAYNGQTNLGFGLIFEEIRELGFWGKLREGFLIAADFVRTVWMSLGDLITGRVGVDQLSGVIGIVDVVSEVGSQSDTWEDGLFNVFYFMALISVNLAVMNLLPIPALDGGRILFVVLNGAIYLVSRRRIPEKYEGYVHGGAFFLLLALMAAVAFRDVWNLFS